MEETDYIDARAKRGKLILTLGAIPSGCLSSVLLICGLLSLVGGMSSISSLDLGAAFGWFFALIMLPASLLLLTLLALSRVNKRGLALAGAAGYLLLSVIGLIWVLLSDLEIRAGLALQVGFFSSIFLITSISSFAGWWLRGSTSKRWVVFSSITGGVVLAGFILAALFAPIQLDATRKVLAGHTNSVRDVTWSPDGDYIASASWDGTVNIWDPTTGEVVKQLIHDEMVDNVDWSPDGTRIASSCDETIFIWNVETGERMNEIMDNPQRVRDLAWSPDSTKLAWLFTEYEPVIIWDVEAEQQLNSVPDQGPTSAAGESILWSSDNTLLSYEVSRRQLIRWNPDTDDGVVDSTNASTWSIDELRDFLKSHKTVSEWSPDEKYLAVGGIDGSITIWDLAGEQPPVALAEHKYHITSLSWSPDGAVLASASTDATILWDMPDGVVRRRFSRHHVWSIAWSPDGTMFATAGQDGNVMVWLFK